MRIAFSAYRGTMQAGGLGMYLYSLTRELAELGFEIDLYVGPPYPDPMPWLRVIQLPNEHYWARRFAKRSRAPPWIPRTSRQHLRAAELLRVRGDPLRLPARDVRLQHAHGDRPCSASFGRGARYDLIHDVQTLGYGLLWLRALGLPAVATVHHPLTIDRRFSLARDR